MDKKAALEILSRVRKAIEAQQCMVDKLVLFGSYATGTTIREGSDIDVVVISKDFAGKDYWQRTDILSQAIYEVFEPIEAVALTPEEWDKGESVVVEYAKNGEVVYG
jgi:predicted nucleotidyltransferase